MEGELGRLGHRTHEHQQAEQQRCPWGHRSGGQAVLQTIGDSLEIEASGGPEQAKDAQQQAEVTNPVHHKSLLSGVGGTVAVVPEAHQQVGAHAHQLPEDVDLQKIGADDQTQHGAAEQRQVREKAHIALVMGHVAVGIHQHQQGDGGDQRQHHRPEWIHHVAHRQNEVAGTGPYEQMLNGRGAIELVEQDAVAEGRSCANAGDQQQRNGFAQPIDRAVEADQSQPGQHCAEQGQNRNEPGEFLGRGHPQKGG